MAAGDLIPFYQGLNTGTGTTERPLVNVAEAGEATLDNQLVTLSEAQSIGTNTSMFPFVLSEARVLIPSDKTIYLSWTMYQLNVQDKYVYLNSTETSSTANIISIHRDATDVVIHTPYSVDKDTDGVTDVEYTTIVLSRPSDGHRIYTYAYNATWIRVIREADGWLVYTDVDVVQKIEDTLSHYDDPAASSSGRGDWSGITFGDSGSQRDYKGLVSLIRSASYTNNEAFYNKVSYLPLLFTKSAYSNTLKLRLKVTSSTNDIMVNYHIKGTNATTLVDTAGSYELNRGATKTVNLVNLEGLNDPRTSYEVTFLTSSAHTWGGGGVAKLFVKGGFSGGGEISTPYSTVCCFSKIH